MLSQDERKALVGRAALEYVKDGEIVGVGTGSTVNHFIEALAAVKHRVRGTVSSSEASTLRLRAHGIAVFDCNAVESLPVYVDGADEIDPAGYMIKGGGGALTREKIVAAQSALFVCIADSSKLVATLGGFALPLEVIPMACNRIMRQFRELGGEPTLRMQNSKPVLTDNGQQLIDVRGLRITQPLEFETMVNQWPGVVTVGVFALQKAGVCLVGDDNGVRTLRFD